MARKVNEVVTRRHLWEGQLRLVAELDGSGNLVSQFVYGTKVNVPEYMIKGGATYRLITDQLGSVRLVVNASTGAVAQRIDYDEFGVATLVTGTWSFQPFGFAGGLYDPDTKLVRFGARDYDADTGRWASKDPIGFGGGDANLYGYVIGDPVNIVDVAGLVIDYGPDPLATINFINLTNARIKTPFVDMVASHFEKAGPDEVLSFKWVKGKGNSTVSCSGGNCVVSYDPCDEPEQALIHEIGGHMGYSHYIAGKSWDPPGSIGGFPKANAHDFGNRLVNKAFPRAFRDVIRTGSQFSAFPGLMGMIEPFIIP